MFPDFLVIGGMKCGSTSLYHDLLAHPDIKLAEKEFNLLSTGDLDKSAVEASYRSAFGPKANQKIRGDVSTTYSMAPHTNAAALAGRVLPPQTKFIYLVREPVSRAISHHHHMHTHPGPERMGPDINKAVHEHPEMIDYGRYAMQLAPWREAFSEGRFRVIRFEDYINNRSEVIRNLYGFLGASPHESQSVVSVHNRSDGKPVLNRGWAALANSQGYRRYLRPLLPRTIRQGAMGLLLPKAPPAFVPPNRRTVELIIESTQEDERELRRFMRSEQPLWDWNAVRRRHTAESCAA